jgi:SecD/SecF fusion protein
MRNLYRHLIIIAVVIVGLTLAILPPDKKLRRGKDLAGGATLVYQVDIRPSDPPGTIDKVKDLIKQRLDPNGLLEIDLVTQGSNRIEITMPLPTERVKQLRAEFEAELETLGRAQVRESQLGQILGLPAAQRDEQLARLSAGDATRAALFDQAVKANEALTAARAKLKEQSPALQTKVDIARQALDAAKAGGQTAEQLKPLTDALTRAEDELFGAAQPVATADIAYETARNAALRSLLSGAEVRRALELSPQARRLSNGDGTFTTIPAPRDAAIERLKQTHAGAAAVIDRVVGKWNAYQAERATLDDPADVIRLLRAAGVLDFRIAPRTGEVTADVARLRAELQSSGPRGVRSSEYRWFKLNKIEGWLRDARDYANFQAMGAAAFFEQQQLIVEPFDGEFYMLLYDQPGLRLTQAEGAWSVASANPTIDELGKPAIQFNMDVLGGSKLSDLTSPNIGRPMAILLDDQVYTAPYLQSRIANSGRITGQFTAAEIDYVVRVLGSGSMAAKLSPEPVSQSTVGPELGADNLDRGIRAGYIAFGLVALIMMGYYFLTCGGIAVLALAINGLLILGLMALNHAAFSLPGIAGVVLTFGMAVDANVLIYERMREEMQQGADFRNAVRLGYSRALPSIVDGNITVLIVVLVLAFTGTQEIKGFAITMIIGSITTFFTQLYVTRVLFYLVVEKWGLRNGSMLAVKVPAISRAFYPRIDWMKYRYATLGLSALLVAAGVWVVASRGADVWDNDFRGGTKITVQLKNGADGKPLLLSRAEAAERVGKVSRQPEFVKAIPEFTAAEVLAINPSPTDPTRSSRFSVKTVEQDAAAVQSAVLAAFRDVVDEQPPIRFAGSAETDPAQAPVRPITDRTLGENIGKPAVRTQVAEFVGGAAVVLENLDPRPSLAQLEERLRLMRNDPVHQGASNRPHQWVILAGDERAVESAVLLVRDEAISYLQDPQRWNAAMRASEWKLISEAMNRATSLAGVESFSASIARTFVTQAITSVLLSGVLIVIYLWLRFQSFRYSFGAICSTLHDCVVAAGALAACGLLVERFPGFAAAIGIEPFKIDLNVVAAVLTILGYSLNDTVIVMDRIRETKGKSAFATKAIVNDAVNSTISRTILTAGLTLIATLALYMIGGEAIRPFAFTFLIGVLTGTYSSIFIAAPLCYVQSKDESLQAGGRALTAAKG